MKHLGDITKIHGYDIEPVDVITGGSPCQDLSVAGKRAGLAGERSGLFMEQIRIVKEMRQHERDNGRPDELIRPRYMVWENVPGAFSSNDGKDFQAVLEEIVKVVETNVPDLRTSVRGGWTKQGCIYSDMGRWSIAWRVHDAQFWGVPQRRKRISLVADFGGLSAPEVLFERTGLSWHSEQSSEKGKGAAGAAESSTGGSSYTLKIRGGVDRDSNGRKAGKGALIQEEKSGTLGVSQDQTLFAFEPGVASRCGGHVYEDKAGTIRANAGDNQQSVVVINGQGGADAQITEDVTATLAAATNGNGNNRCAVAYNIGSYESNSWKSSNPHSGVYETERTKTIDVNCGDPSRHQGGTAVVQGADMFNQALTGDVTMPLTAAASDAHHVPCVVGVDTHNCELNGEISATLTANSAGSSTHMGVGKIMMCYGMDNERRRGVDEYEEVSPTLTARIGMGGGNTPVVTEPIAYPGASITNPLNGNNPKPGDPCHSITTDERNYVIQPTMIEMTSTKNTVVEDGISPTLTARMGTGGNQVNALCMETSFYSAYEEQSPAQLSRQYKDPNIVSIGIDRAAYNMGENAKGTPTFDNDLSASLVRSGPNAVETRSVVRRLTPMECERLQGYPDGWTDIGETVIEDVADYEYFFDEDKFIAPNVEDFGLTEEDISRNDGIDIKEYEYEVEDEDEDEDDEIEEISEKQKQYMAYLEALDAARKAATRKIKIGTHKEAVKYWTDSNGKIHKTADSPRYKALGNSIALPFWFWLLRRIAAQYERPATLGSLFDGIGGFPLCWERCNGKGTARWASEIEEFPIAVTKYHFGEE